MAKKKPSQEESAPKKTKGQAAPSRDERAAMYLEHVQKKMKGRAQIKRASEYYLPYLTKRLPTGILTLDVELRGGFPCGGLSQIIGPKNSGKSYLTWQVIRQLQYILGEDMKVLLAMTEMRADRSQARAAGVQISMGDEDIEAMDAARQANGWPAFTKEEIKALKVEVGQIDELHGVSGEDLYDGILTAVEASVYHLIVIDSFGNIMAKAEEEAESLNEKTYGGSSQINTKFLRKLGAMLSMDDDYGNTRDVCVIGINHVRDAIGDPNREYKAPGGKALEHAKFVDLYIASGKPTGYNDSVFGADMMAKQRFVQTGKETNWKIEKGKAGIHEGGRGSYVYDFRINQADFYSDTFVAGATAGIIEMTGTWCRLPDPNDPSKFLLSVQGRQAFVEALIADDKAKSGSGEKSFMNLIRDMVYKKKEINIDYEWDK